MPSERPRARQKHSSAGLDTSNETNRPPAASRRWLLGFCYVCLIAAIWAVFEPTRRHGFINFDDGVYVYENSLVQRGITVPGIVWAFTHSHAGNWHPLTTLSHMLDCQLYGVNAGGHHLTNVLLHCLTAILFFRVLVQMTATLWPAAFVAVLFAIHPLRVESVAWVAERKDVLSGMFFMLTLAAYVRYARQAWSFVRYLPVLIFFALGLISKPMLVTLPCVLLLLDFWPLRRFRPRAADGFSTNRRLIIEKIPLLALSGGMCVITLLVQAQALPTISIPFSFRISNALVSCMTYVGQLFYPANLAVFYPYPTTSYSFWTIGLLLLVMTVIFLGCLRWRHRHPYLLVGWLWYLVMLVPVLGIVQVGGQARADRYTYLPEIGLGLALTWAVRAWSCSGRRRALLGVGAVTILAALIVTARTQVGYWRDSETLWQRTLACTTDNAIAENNLAKFYLTTMQYEPASAHARAAVTIDPNNEEAHNSLALALFSQGKTTEAIVHYETALKIKPDYLEALNNLGQAFLLAGRSDEAIGYFQKALELPNPDVADAVELHSNLGAALFLKGRTEAAVVHLHEAIELKPDAIGALGNLAWILATSPDPAIRDGAKAIKLARQAERFTNGKDPKILSILAAACAEAGRFPEALQTAQVALQLARVQTNTALIEVLHNGILLYQAGRPFRDNH